MPIFSKKNGDKQPAKRPPKISKEQKAKDKKKADEALFAKDFIPYATHYSTDTILTKNGELCQTITISDINIGANDDIRKALRDAISKHINPLHYAIWVHMLHEDNEAFDEDDAYNSNPVKQWDRKIRSNKKYHNSLYITIIHDSATYKNSTGANFIRNFSFKNLVDYRSNHLKNNKVELDKVVKNILEDFKEFSPRKLSIYQDSNQENGKLYSEPLSFFNKILTKDDEEIALERHDYSALLANSKTKFYPYPGFVEMTKKNGEKKFSSVLTLKEFFIVRPHVLSAILTLDFEYTICHSIEFSKNYEQLEAIKRQKHYNNLSGDKEFASALAHDFEPDIRNIGMEQVSFHIFADTPEELEERNQYLNDKLTDIGISFIHEDIKMEHCYWAALPANFNFLRRQHIAAKKNAFGLASLGSDISGRMKGKWGEYVAAFETSSDHIYYFNFFDKTELGHTLIVGNEYYSKIPLANFLAASCTKYNAKLFYLGAENYTDKIFATCPTLDGEYLTFENIEQLYEAYNYILANSKTDRKVAIVINLPNNVEEMNAYAQSLKEFLSELDSSKFVIITTCCDAYNLQSNKVLEFFPNQIYSDDFRQFENLDIHFNLVEDEIFEIDKLDICQYFLKQDEQDAVIYFDPSESKELAEMLDSEDMAEINPLKKMEKVNSSLEETFHSPHIEEKGEFK